MEKVTNSPIFHFSRKTFNHNGPDHREMGRVVTLAKFNWMRRHHDLKRIAGHAHRTDRNAQTTSAIVIAEGTTLVDTG